MIEANELIIPIAGTLIVGMAGLLIWAGKRFLSKSDDNYAEIKEILLGIKNDIEELKLEYHLMKNHMGEIEGRTENRFQGLEKQITDNRNNITDLRKEVTELQKTQQIYKILHLKNHPNDNFTE